jgi:protein involved in polysaccharide export with SLBB domain
VILAIVAQVIQPEAVFGIKVAALDSFQLTTIGFPMVFKYARLASVLLFGLLLTGCYTEYGPVEVATAPVSPAGASLAALLQPGEKIKITVYGEDALTGEYDISPNGYVSMPLIGTVRAAGQTPVELGRVLSGKFRAGGVLQDPHVNVAVVTFKPFYVIGEANTPGEYPYRSGLTVHSAVAMAGGFTYRASRSIVLIRHTGDDVWREYPLTEPVPIAPGDLIRVPERYF